MLQPNCPAKMHFGLSPLLAVSRVASTQKRSPHDTWYLDRPAYIYCMRAAPQAITAPGRGAPVGHYVPFDTLR